MLLLSFLPIALGSLFLVYFSISILQFDLRQNHLCRTASLKTQNEVGKWLKELLAQNPKAAKLRQEEWRLKAEILIAPNPAAKARAIAMLQKVLQERSVLAAKQKQLIRASDLALLTSETKTRWDLARSHQQHWGQLKGYIFSSYRPLHVPAPKLAVRPDIPDIAPVYLLQEPFKDKQALVQKWQYDFQVGTSAKEFLRGRFSWQRECSVTLHNQGSIWTAKIHKAKSLSKSLW